MSRPAKPSPLAVVAAHIETLARVTAAMRDRLDALEQRLSALDGQSAKKEPGR